MVEASLEAAEYMKKNAVERKAVSDLVERTSDHRSQDNNFYSVEYIKKMLEEHLGKTVIMTSTNGQAGVVTTSSSLRYPGQLL